MNYILDFKNDLSIADIDQYLLDHGYTKIEEYSFFDRVYLVNADTTPVVDDYVESVVLDEGNPLELLGFNVPVEAEPAVSSTFVIDETKNWWKTVCLNNVDFEQSTHTFERYGVNSVVYILDSGIDIDHPEFASADVELLYSFTGDFTDHNGHGTAIASVISGDTCGATTAKIKVVKIFQHDVPTLQSQLLAALDAVATDYVANGKLPSVVNCSWTIPFNPYVNSKIQALIDTGVFVVAAAGNSGLPVTDVTPACIEDVLTVGSFGQSLTPSDFSNYTDPSFISFTENETNMGELDGWAPGEMVWAAGPGGIYGYTAGTSIAAAIASAAIAYNVTRNVTNEGVNIETLTNHSTYAEYLAERAELLGRDYAARDSYRILVFSRADVLDLSDPKYAGSQNMVVGFRESVDKPDAAVVRNIATSGERAYFISYSNRNVVGLSSDADLPSYVSILSNGIIVVDCPPITNNYVMTRTPIDIHYADGSTAHQIVEIIVFKDAYTYINRDDVLPEDDPILAILLAGCDGFNWPNCTDDCDGMSGYICYTGSKSSPYCSCYYFNPSDIRLKGGIQHMERVGDINLYSFYYLSNPTVIYVGVMAQELLGTKYHDAVIKRHDGFYVVDYGQLPQEVQDKSGVM